MAITNFHAQGVEFLSNFYEAPVKIGHITYRNAEAAFQAQKCANEDDRLSFASVSAAEAKRIGRAVKINSAAWDNMRISVMFIVVFAKFTQNSELGKKLVATGDEELVEGNNWNDTFWGVDSRTGEGRNILGKILMKVRDTLR